MSLIEKLLEIQEPLTIDAVCGQEINDSSALVLTQNGSIILTITDDDDSTHLFIFGHGAKPLKQLIAAAQHLLTHIN